MNYRHAFHAGNHADVLKHITTLAVCDALTAKPAPLFALDTHGGRGLYALDSNSAQRTGEAEAGIGRLMAEAPRHPVITRYLAAVKACRAQHGPNTYPGSPWLLAHALREDDRIAVCELLPEEAEQLKANFAGDPRVATHARDGYEAMKALLPPRLGELRYNRGIVLIDPPYESQLQELDIIIAALRDALVRWPNACYAVWYPIKLRRSLNQFFRRAATLPVKSSLLVELMVHPDDSPLRLNGSGMLLLNAPWQFDKSMREVLPLLQKVLGEDGASWRVEWLKQAD